MRVLFFIYFIEWQYDDKGGDKMAVHVVKSGENLWSIFHLYGKPIQSIMKVNCSCHGD